LEGAFQIIERLSGIGFRFIPKEEHRDSLGSGLNDGNCVIEIVVITRQDEALARGIRWKLGCWHDAALARRHIDV
jgi:hypothetical protein